MNADTNADAQEKENIGADGSGSLREGDASDDKPRRARRNRSRGGAGGADGSDVSQAQRGGSQANSNAKTPVLKRKRRRRWAKMPPPYVLIGKKKIPCQSIDVSMVDRGILMLIFSDHTEYVPWPAKGFSFYKEGRAVEHMPVVPPKTSNLRTMDLDGRELFARFGNVPPPDTEMHREAEVANHRRTMNRTLEALAALPGNMSSED